MIFSRIKQSYKNFESMIKINEMRMRSIFVNVAFNTELISKSWIIAKSLIAKTLRVTRLHFIENQCKIIACVESVKQITYSICENESRLFANKKSVNIINCRNNWFSLTYRKSLTWLIICHCKRLFNVVTSSEQNVESVEWTAWLRSNDASNWHINIK
jgi:hypothetical protein